MSTAHPNDEARRINTTRATVFARYVLAVPAELHLWTRLPDVAHHKVLVDRVELQNTGVRIFGTLHRHDGTRPKPYAETFGYRTLLDEHGNPRPKTTPGPVSSFPAALLADIAAINARVLATQQYFTEYLDELTATRARLATTEPAA